VWGLCLKGAFASANRLDPPGKMLAIAENNSAGASLWDCFFFIFRKPCRNGAFQGALEMSRQGLRHGASRMEKELELAKKTGMFDPKKAGKKLRIPEKAWPFLTSCLWLVRSRAW
jgi:hypothetical protein